MKFPVSGSCHAKLGLEESPCCALLGGPRGTHAACDAALVSHCNADVPWKTIARMFFKQKSSIVLVESSFSVLKHHCLKALFHCNTDLPHPDSFLPDQTLSRLQHFCHEVWA